jgi:hypothetical protein
MYERQMLCVGIKNDGFCLDVSQNNEDYEMNGCFGRNLCSKELASDGVEHGRECPCFATISVKNS